MMTLLPRTLAVALLAPLLFGGCSALSALNSEPLDAYELHASPNGPRAQAQQSIQVTVEQPSASAAIDTDGILIRPGATQIFYAADARWIETAPLMVQSALVDALDRTGAFRFVGRRPLSASGDYALVSSVSEFHAQLSPDETTATVHIRITVRMVREDDASVVASETFEATALAPGTETEVIVDAFDLAATQALDEIVAWVLQTRGVRFTAPSPA